MQNILVNSVQTIIFSFLLVVISVPFVKRLAFKLGALDQPDKRKVHKNPIPRLGGLAIYFSFLVSYLVFSEPNIIMNAILIATFLIVLVGIVDDVKPLEANIKFVVQIMAALVLVLYGELLIEFVEIYGNYIEFGWWAYPITVLFILLCINCLNFIDGLDGLAAGVSSIYFITIVIISITMANYNISFLITTIMLGATLGFLVYNFNPASIFMGDTGSTFLGLIIASITLLGFKTVTLTSLFVPITLLLIPILDTFLAIGRRKIKGQKITTPDKFHIHHQLLNRNISHRNVVLIIYLINGLFSLSIILFMLEYITYSYILYLILLFIISLFIVKTEVLFKKGGNKWNVFY